MKKINEQKMDRLTELIRTASKAIHPEDSNYHYLYHKDIRDKLYGQKPECFVQLKRKGGGVMGRDTSSYMLPVCNRAGHEDAKVINISLKIVKQLIDDEKGMYDINDLKKVAGSLQRKHAIFSKQVPKPPVTAAKKAMITKMFNKIRGHLNQEY